MQIKILITTLYMELNVLNHRKSDEIINCTLWKIVKKISNIDDEWSHKLSKHYRKFKSEAAKKRGRKKTSIIVYTRFSI